MTATRAARDMCQQVVALAQGKVGEFASALPKGEEMTSGADRAVYKLNYSCENSPERALHLIPLAETVPCYQSSLGVALGLPNLPGRLRYFIYRLRPISTAYSNRRRFNGRR